MYNIYYYIYKLIKLKKKLNNLFKITLTVKIKNRQL